MGRAHPCTVNILVSLLSQRQIEPLSPLTGLQEFLPCPCGQIAWIFLGENQFRFTDHLTTFAGFEAVFRKSSRQIISNADVALSVPQTAQDIERDGL